MPREDTTRGLITKEWEHLSVRLPKGLKKLLKEQAKAEMRPVGLHASYIIMKHLEEEKNGS